MEEFITGRVRNGISCRRKTIDGGALYSQRYLLRNDKKIQGQRFSREFKKGGSEFRNENNVRMICVAKGPGKN